MKIWHHFSKGLRTHRPAHGPDNLPQPRMKVSANQSTSQGPNLTGPDLTGPSVYETQLGEVHPSYTKPLKLLWHNHIDHVYENMHLIIRYSNYYRLTLHNFLGAIVLHVVYLAQEMCST